MILTPHAAFYSLEAEKELRRKAAQNIITWFATGKPEYVVVRGTRGPDPPRQQPPMTRATPSARREHKGKEETWPR